MVPIFRRIACILMAGVLSAAACQKKTPPAPSAGNGTDGGIITGRENIGWDQQATNASDLPSFRFAIYVDGVRSEIAEASCGRTAASAGFPCTGRLPAMTPGSHTLQIAAFVVDGEVRESPRSAPLRVTIVPSGTSATSPVERGWQASTDTWSSGPAGVTIDGTALAVERIADGLVDPVDLAVADDRRVFVAQRTAGVRIIAAADDPGSVAALDLEGGQLQGLALDPHFARTHLVYVLYVAPSREGFSYRVARFREIDGSFGERAVLLNDLARAATPLSAALRITPDGRLLIALPDGGRATGSSYEGKLLRTEADGSTPREQNGTPVIAAELEHPFSLAWDRTRSSAWITDRRAAGDTLSGFVLASGAAARAAMRYRIPGSGTASIAVYEGTLLPRFANDLLLASSDGFILRLGLPQDMRSRQFTTERLLEDRVGPVLLVASSPDGAIYFSTADALGRIVIAR